mmetsp:Transcript_17150/g.16369  ORF Transcript_17150/g.16369 Transcript_17150/m.16369 type:complete len:126 (+) Transcript_17150:1390-1767(+)
MVLFNFVLIPLLVDLVAALDTHETKSGKQLSILRINFVFMILNNIFLPMTGLITIKEFLDLTLNSIEAKKLFQEIAKNIGLMGAFFLKYLMQITFISNGVQLLDLPHFLVKTLKKWCRSNKQKPF